MNVVLGVGGGIAAYKSAELARALMERGMRVQVVMTDAAREFITPLTFASLTGHKVITGLFASGSSDETNSEETLSSAVEHIAVAQDNEVLVIAPATADLMARLAHGLADDFLTTMYLAFTGRVVLAPAMNNNMWTHPATQENLTVLRKRGHIIIDPEEGAGKNRRRGGRLEFWIARSGRRDGSHHGRPYAGTAGSGALYFQPIQRQNGLRAGRSSGATRRASDPGLRSRTIGGAARRARGTGAHRS